MQVTCCFKGGRPSSSDRLPSEMQPLVEDAEVVAETVLNNCPRSSGKMVGSSMKGSSRAKSSQCMPAHSFSGKYVS